MKRFNLSRIRGALAVSAGIFAVTGLSGAAVAVESELYYQYYFYSDASHSELVGEVRQVCQNSTYIITPLVIGTATPYYTMEAIGYCPGNGDW